MAEASRPTWGYWNIRAGPRGNINRHIIALSGANVEIKNYTFGTEEWANEKNNLGLDFPNLPYIIDGDFKITESKAVTLYLCEKYMPSLLGATVEQQAHARMLQEVINDMFMAGIGIGFKEDEPHAMVTEKFDSMLPAIVNYLGQKQWFLGDQIGLPDLMMYEMIETYKGVTKDDSFDGKYPTLKAVYDRVGANPTFSAYRASDKYLAAPFFIPACKLNM